MTLSFGLTASSALQELRTRAGAFRRYVLNDALARDCAEKAWHLCDHFFHEAGSNSTFPDLGSLQDHVRQACPELGYLQDICIASKHAKITRYPPSITEARKLDGDFCREDFDKNDFNVPRLEITVADGPQLLFDDVLERAVAFWTQFFRNHGIT